MRSELIKFKGFKNTNSSIPRKYHIIFWTCYFIFDVIQWGSYYDDYLYSLRSNMVTFPMKMILVYFNIYWLIPKFIIQKNIKKYILFFILSLCVFYVIRTELIYYFVNENVWPESESPQKAYSFNHIVVVFLIGIYEVAIVTTLKLMWDWIAERKRTEHLQELQLKTELKFLKSQIQPHFFFNTLNNLYALTLEKSDSAPGVVLKLSKIMEYVIYDVKKKSVRLFDEIKHIQNYIDLERLRFGDSLNVDMEIIGNINDVKVPPLLFLTFIENCFKHGTKIDNVLKVHMKFEKTNDNFLKFNLENTFEKSEYSNLKNGIGIENVKRRLEILFKNNYELKNMIFEQKYIVQLKIPIK
jgi:hypothetical protein